MGVGRERMRMRCRPYEKISYIVSEHEQNMVNHGDISRGELDTLMSLTPDDFETCMRTLEKQEQGVNVLPAIEYLKRYNLLQLSPENPVETLQIIKGVEEDNARALVTLQINYGLSVSGYFRAFRGAFDYIQTALPLDDRSLVYERMLNAHTFMNHVAEIGAGFGYEITDTDLAS